jgi:hypothetical protein
MQQRLQESKHYHRQQEERANPVKHGSQAIHLPLSCEAWNAWRGDSVDGLPTKLYNNVISVIRLRIEYRHTDNRESPRRKVGASILSSPLNHALLA